MHCLGPSFHGQPSYRPVFTDNIFQKPIGLLYLCRLKVCVSDRRIPMFPFSDQQVMEELKEQARIALPLTVMNLVVYARGMVSVLCLGRLGSLELAGGALSIGFTNITGYSVLFGLAAGLYPICGQAFGSQNWSLVGLSLQRTILVLLTACIPISILWLNLQRIMLWFGQDPSITAVASMYCLYTLPDLLADSILQPLRVYLSSQGSTMPMMWCSIVALVLHIPINVMLVFVFRLGVPGVAIAAVWTNFHLVIFLVGYVWYSGLSSRTWREGWSIACLQQWGPLLKLALPSCLATCLEWWWYEILTVLAGYLPDPQVAIGATAILIQTNYLIYTFSLALSSSVSARVSNELGANRPTKARIAAWVSLSCAFASAILSLTWTTLCRHKWGSIFTDDRRVAALAGAMMPIIGLCELGNCPQTTGCGILRGSARVGIGVEINLGSFYLLGTPVAVGLAFWRNAGFSGLWFGLLAAEAACACSVLYVIIRTDWAHEALKARDFIGSSTCSKGSKSSVDAGEMKGDETRLLARETSEGSDGLMMAQSSAHADRAASICSWMPCELVIADQVFSTCPPAPITL